jgi:hypothetical protein
VALADLLNIRKVAQEAFERCQDDMAEAESFLANCKAAFEKATAEIEAANTAIHDLLSERGVHFMQHDDGSIMTYHAREEAPGWYASHPIPGHEPVKDTSAAFTA